MISLSKTSLHVYFAAFSAFYFSYLPFIYIINSIGINKQAIFYTLFSLALLTIFIYKNFNSKQVKIDTKRKYLILFLYLFFSLYAYISYKTSINYLNDSKMVLTLAVVNPIFIYLALFNSPQKKILFKFLYLISSIYFIFIFIRWINNDLNPSSATGFISVFNVMKEGGGEYQNLNKYLGLFSLLIIGFYSFYNLKIKILSLAMLVLTLYFMMLIGGRGSVVSLAIVFFFWSILTIKDSDYAFPFIFMTSSIVVIGVIIINLVDLNFAQLTQDTKLISLQRFLELQGDNDSSSRGFLFSKAFELFSLNLKNILFGAGMNYFPVFTGWWGTGSYPHNIILELLAEYGLLGFSLFSFPIIYLFYIRYKKLGSFIGSNKIERLAFMVFLYYLINNLTSGGLRDSWQFIFILYLLYPTKKLQYTTSTK